MNRTKRKIFGREAIEKILGEIGDALEGEVRAVLIGGGAMSLKGKKPATKDVDIAIVSPEEHKIFLHSLLRLGFTRTMNFDEKMLKTKNSMNDSPVFVNRDGAHVDIFPDTVCKRFHIHEGIIRRTKKHGQYHNLKVSLLSDEDIFLSKSVTERDHDLEDMYRLFVKGLNGNIIISEAKHQTTLSDNTLWSTFLKIKLDELEEKFDFTVPWKQRVEGNAIKEMETALQHERSDNAGKRTSENGKIPASQSNVKHTPEKEGKRRNHDE